MKFEYYFSEDVLYKTGAGGYWPNYMWNGSEWKEYEDGIDVFHWSKVSEEKASEITGGNL